MANYKDNNADIGNQTIEGTQPPIALDAEIVMPENDIPTAAELDEQLARLMADPIDQNSVITPPPQNAASDDLDAQLAALIADTDKPNDTADINADIDDINAQIDAILNEKNWSENDQPIQVEPVVSTEATIVVEPVAEAIVVPDESATQSAETPAEPVVIVGEPTEPAATPSEEPIFVEEPIVPPAEPAATPISEADNVIVGEPADQPAPEPVIVGEPTEPVSSDTNTEKPITDESNEQKPVTPDQSVKDAIAEAVNAQADEARAMLEQTRLLMEQMREQAQAQAEQARQSAADAQSAEMLRQAQELLLQARNEKTQQAPSPEVDALKSELAGMRELVNSLTMTISQLQNGGSSRQMQQQMPQMQQMQQIPQMPPYMFAAQQPPQQQPPTQDREQFKKLESELERVRREIIEKDLRDREKELDRRQKEAESTVKDIRPEMVQMSDSRDIAPMQNPNATVGGEFIPLANGVYYSIKDKQVYVMTPASNAAAASPTIEPKRPAPRPAPKKRTVVARRRPSAPLRRRPGAPRRPRPHR